MGPAPSAPKRRRRWPWVTAAAVVVIIVIALAAGSGNKKNASSGTPSAGSSSNNAAVQTTSTTSPLAYIASAKPVRVADLDKDPAAYNGDAVGFPARIVNFLKDNSGATAAMNVSDPHDPITVIYVQLSATADVADMNKGDAIMVWGNAVGSLKGKNAFGGTINESAVNEVYLSDTTTGYKDTGGIAPPDAAASPSTAAPAQQAASPPTAPALTTPTRHVEGAAATLGAGQFTGGKDIQAGLYDVTAGPGESGNFIVNGNDSYNEILGGSDGVPKVRATISDGDSIQIGSLSQVTFTPVTAPFVTTHSAVSLYAGTWTVGQDVGPGRYVATPGAGQSGNFIIDAEDVNEILGGPDGVPNITFNVRAGDVITVGSLSQVTLTPA